MYLFVAVLLIFSFDSIVFGSKGDYIGEQEATRTTVPIQEQKLRGLGLVPKVRIRSGSLAAEGHRAHDRMCDVLARVLLIIQKLRAYGRQCHEEVSGS